MNAATVRVCVATLWRAPEDAGPGDADALGELTDVRAWCAGLSAADRAHRPAVLSQLPLGEEVLVEEVRDGWARVLVPGQPSDLDTRGYPGWLPVRQLGSGGRPGYGALTVAATATTLRDAPEGDLVLRNVIIGTRLHLAADAPEDLVAHGEHEVEDDWLAVGVPGWEEPLWARALDLAREPGHTPAPRDVLLTATRLRDVPHVWGGLSPFGIDAPGLVHLAWRRHGVILPRDARHQAALAEPVELGTERPGDLYFFARPGERVDHVGIVASAPRGERRAVLHACPVHGHVLVEQVTGKRAATLVGAGRISTG